MKHLKPILIVLILCFTIQSNAQIWKKLGKKVEKAAERTIEKKVEEKTERETEKAFDSTFNNGNKNKKSNSKKSTPLSMGKSAESPASTYSFSHKYVMQINDGKRTMDLVYYLTKSENYFATSIPDKKGKNNMTSVMDIDKKSMYMFMDNKNDKTMMSMSLDFEDTTNNAIEESNINVTATGNTKTILGYNCEEFKVKGEDMEGSVWVTQQADVTFAKSMYSVKTKKGLDQSWMKMINGLALEMDMIDTSKRKPKPIKMTCIALDKINLSIDTSQYKKLM